MGMCLCLISGMEKKIPGFSEETEKGIVMLVFSASIGANNGKSKTAAAELSHYIPLKAEPKHPEERNPRPGPLPGQVLRHSGQAEPLRPKQSHLGCGCWNQPRDFSEDGSASL